MFLGIEVSETFLIAVVTFLSGFFGALIALLGVVISSSKTASSQIQQTIVKEMFLARKIAYSAVFAAETKITAAGQDLELLTKAIMNFEIAVSDAKVVASFDTTLLLDAFSRQITSKLKGGSYIDNRSALLVAMQKDLSIFTAPAIVRNQWFTKLCKRPARTAAKRVAKSRTN